MKINTLSQSNRHLKDKARAAPLVIRSIASSTAIETGESISKIEAKLKRLRSAVNRVKLA